MALAAGSRLGPYEVRSLLGAGGMGEVYEGFDPRLDRLVALKVLSGDVATDPDRLARFEREAKAVAALNHPNIVTLYGIEEADGIRFLAMERIQGKPLSDLIEPGGLPLKTILDWAVPIADALAAAHAHGVVHRDLKPGNVMINEEGRPKILDFGLARISAPSSSPVHAESVTEAMTAQGAVFGTVPYMAPEQLRGERADARADLFSFGAILYEMAAGRRPFIGATGAEIAAAILARDPPPLAGIRTDIPAAFARIVGHCLEKDPHQRVQSAADLRHELSDLAEELHTRPGAVAIAAPARASAAKRRWVSITSVAAVLLALLGAVLLLKPFGSKPALAKPIASIAVLPLKNYSGDASQDYFADGMTDALISNLAQIRALKVISRTSAMLYKDSKKPLPQIAKELGVEGIVEGSVVRSGSRVRVTAQLVNAAQDRNVWANDYEREMTDILSLQSEVVRAIAGEIRVQVTPQEEKQLRASRPVSPEVYELTLMAWHFQNEGTSQDFSKAIEYFQKATALDPGYANAQAGLSIGLSTAALYGVLPANDALPRAKITAKRALELDESVAEAHVALGVIAQMFDRDWKGAEREYKRALAIAPNSATALTWYAVYLTVMKRFDEAIALRMRAVDLDPLSIPANDFFGWTLYYAGRYDESIRQYLKVIELAPNKGYLHMWLSGNYVAAHDSGLAVAECRRALALEPEDQFVLTNCGRHFAVLGDRKGALALLERTIALSRTKSVDPYQLAYLYSGLGEKTLALTQLERALEEHSPSLFGDPDLDFAPVLSAEPRYQEIRRRLNLPIQP